ncbi:MAG: hypothetical protein FWD63_09305 [Propionibacteriaceae bacterium]|nr:hypothetical protein [Propionibacteriaceae bacterium]
MKKPGLQNIIIGVLWIIIGVIALSAGIQLALFHVIPINGIVVILLGVVWAGFGIYQKTRPVQPPPQPQAYPYPQAPGPNPPSAI